MRFKFVKSWSKVVNVIVVGFAWEANSGRGGCVERGLSHLIMPIYIYIYIVKLLLVLKT